MYHNIKDGAVFIADSHFNSNRKELLFFLDNLPDETSQIFLMGDIFDFLSPTITYFTKKNEELISIINTLSLSIEIIYIEGNHDFNIKQLFPKCMVMPREDQPMIFDANNKRILLSHGDLDMGFWYEFYTFFIRKNCFLQLLEWIDINNWFTKWVDSKLQEKKLYYEFNDFESFAQKRLDYFSSYNVDMIIEGHYHQGKVYKKYINLPTFTNKQYMIYTNKEFLVREI